MIRHLLESITGYPALLLACAGSGIVVPLPEDFPLLYAGMRIGEGTWTWGATIAVALVGVAIRDVLAWSAGRVLGDLLLHRPEVRRLLGARRIDRARAMIARHGASAVLLGRFLVGFRAPVFAVAGATGVPLRAFATFDVAGLAIAVPLAVGLGFAFGQPLADLVFLALQRARLIVALTAAIVVLGSVWRMAASASQAAPTPEDEKNSSQ